MIIRSEIAADISAIRKLTDAAFQDVQHSSQTEGAIVDALRLAGALAISLVAEKDGEILGHLAFSPVLIDGQDIGWFGLGPVSVSPTVQRSGIGSALIKEGLKSLRDRGALGSVVLGDPDYYQRFGFTSAHNLRYSDVPATYFQSIAFADPPAKGVVTYHDGFEAQ
ncbi:MAG: N-acetyltransferase [Hyphomicrobiales bacterium]|nr:MAG: N-acetyltransferase [Hyphomicrobiales bacterium]